MLLAAHLPGVTSTVPVTATPRPVPPISALPVPSVYQETHVAGSLSSKGQFGWALLAWLQPTPPETVPTGAHQLQGLGRAVL